MSESLLSNSHLDQFPNAGQNIGASMNQGVVNPDHVRIFDQVALDWFNQYQNGNMNTINRFSGPGNGYAIIFSFNTFTKNCSSEIKLINSLL